MKRGDYIKVVRGQYILAVLSNKLFSFSLFSPCIKFENMEP